MKKNAKKLLSLLLTMVMLLTSVGVFTPTVSADSEILSFNGHYYQFIKGAITWSGAQNTCELMGGYLATITTQEEADFLTNNMPKNIMYWLGGKVHDGTTAE